MSGSCKQVPGDRAQVHYEQVRVAYGFPEPVWKFKASALPGLDQPDYVAHIFFPLPAEEKHLQAIVLMQKRSDAVPHHFWRDIGVANANNLHV